MSKFKISKTIVIILLYILAFGLMSLFINLHQKYVDSALFEVCIFASALPAALADYLISELITNKKMRYIKAFVLLHAGMIIVLFVFTLISKVLILWF